MKSLTLVALSALLLAGCQSESTTDPTATITKSSMNLTPSLGEDSTEQVVETTPVVFNVEGAPTKAFHVPDMMCEFGCPPAVKEVLTAQAGVVDVKIEYETKKAIVAIDEATFDANAAVAALVDYQFGNTKLIVAEE